MTCRLKNKIQDPILNKLAANRKAFGIEHGARLFRIADFKFRLSKSTKCLVPSA